MNRHLCILTLRGFAHARGLCPSTHARGLRPRSGAWPFDPRSGAWPFDPRSGASPTLGCLAFRPTLGSFAHARGLCPSTHAWGLGFSTHTQGLRPRSGVWPTLEDLAYAQGLRPRSKFPLALGCSILRSGTALPQPTLGARELHFFASDKQDTYTIDTYIRDTDAAT
jgi:hypothetical protein